MNKQWLPENSVADSEIELMSQKGAVRAFHIVEHEAEELYYVTLFYTWRAELLHLSTRRVKTEPKMWKSLDRLIAHIKAKFPRIRRISLMLRDQDPKTVRLLQDREEQPRATEPLKPQSKESSNPSGQKFTKGGVPLYDVHESGALQKSAEATPAEKKAPAKKPSTKARAKASKTLRKVSKPQRK